MPKNTPIRLIDGQYDWSGGVDSAKIPALKSILIPNGLGRDQLSWLQNGTVRGGTIHSRGGWTKLARVSAGGELYQSGSLYYPNNADPYLMLSVGGRIVQVRVDSDNSVVDLSAAFSLNNPTGTRQGFMCQGEEFLVIQAGDYTTLPLFWDNATLRRSVGITQPPLSGGSFNVPPIGQTVQVTLSARPDVNTGDVVTLNGHNYQVVSSTSFCDVTFTQPDTTAPNSWFGTLVAGTVFTGNPNAVTLTAKYVTISNSASTTVPGWLFAGETPINGNFLIHIITVFPAFVTYFAQITPSAVGEVGAFDVILMNVDDPHLGNTVNIPLVGSELPAAGAMDYYMGRIWYSNNQLYSAGDIVGGPNGTIAYKFRDSILKVTENPLAIGGDGFKVPLNTGSITALKHPQNLDESMGQGLLTIFTAKSVFQLKVPVTREDWINASSANPPKQTEVQQTNGTVAERSVVSVNGDLFYYSVDGVRSLITAIRYFGTWGNIPISREETVMLLKRDQPLMGLSSAVSFDNRLLQTIMPINTSAGIAYQALAVLDFDVISTLKDQQSSAPPAPAWEGAWKGLNILQLFEGNFSGTMRCFAVTISQADGGIDVWELIPDTCQDCDIAYPGHEADMCQPIDWIVDFPSFYFAKEHDMKQLDGGELWLDQITSDLILDFYYRPDADPRWHLWHHTEFKMPVAQPVVPVNQTVPGEAYAYPVQLPVPPFPDSELPTIAPPLGRPNNQGYMFQVRVKVRGAARVRGLLVFATAVEQPPFSSIT